MLLFVALLSFFSITEGKKDCYVPGTLDEIDVEVNVNNFCPCKFGYYGPRCFDIYSCVSGNLTIASCQNLEATSGELYFRCVQSGDDSVTICECSENFRGETCEYLVTDSFTTWIEVFKNSNRFYSHVFIRENSTKNKIYNWSVKISLALLSMILLINLYWKYGKYPSKNRQIVFTQLPTSILIQKPNVQTRNLKISEINKTVERSEDVNIDHEKVILKMPSIHV